LHDLYRKLPLEVTINDKDIVAHIILRRPVFHSPPDWLHNRNLRRFSSVLIMTIFEKRTIMLSMKEK